MLATDSRSFRRMCGQFRWLAVFMVASVGLVLTLMHIIAPAVLWARGEFPSTLTGYLADLVRGVPSALYLLAVWSIGSAMGQLAKGRMIQPTLASALRRVGLALGFGGLISVFGVTNLIRLLGETRGGFLHFDVSGMTLGMIGGALFLLGRVIEQAGAVQAELDEMI